MANLFNEAKKLQPNGFFSYLAKNKEMDLLDKITEGGDEKTLNDEKHKYLLRKSVQQPTALYCGNEEVNHGTCCFAHIVESKKREWESGCKTLDDNLRTRLKSKMVSDNLPMKKVLASINIEGRRVKPSREWEIAYNFLSLAFPLVLNRNEMNPQFPAELSPEERGIVKEVKLADKSFTNSHPKGYSLYPTQVASVLLNVYGVVTGTKLIMEMKTGEGKTYVCGLSAAVVAKLFDDGPAVILTSSMDRAIDDKSKTSKFIKEYLGREPIFLKALKPGSTDKNVPSPEGQVCYGQVSDAQRICVDMLTAQNPKGLYEFLKTASFFLDEADHVLIEQAESLLYISSPCPSYYSLHGVNFNIQHRIDFEGNFQPPQVKTRAAIKDAADKLTKDVLEKFRFYEEDHGKKLPGGYLHPTIIDLTTFVAANGAGAMSARFKENGKEYVLEITTKDDHGTILNVEKITIVDQATGTESDGTRWTTEAPFCEAMEELPIGGSDPLAFYCSFPYLLEKLRWFGGITGTIGAAHTLDFYKGTYGVKCTFKIPRNKPTTVYRLPTKVARNEEQQLKNICEAVKGWTQETIDIPARGPVLIIAESIQKARLISEELKKQGHALTKAKDFVKKKLKKKNKSEEEEEVEGEEEESNEVEVESWTIDESSKKGECAHLFQYFKRCHHVMEKFPDCAVVVASNKGGRGLDLKLDHDKCPKQTSGHCSLSHHPTTRETEMGSVLFVILTEVLPGRQDEQAVGRCGRNGKGGVVQYLLVKNEEEDTNPISDPDAVYLERKNKKDSEERDDLKYKGNRIEQHRFDGKVLDQFCENLSTYVSEWMLKLFPPHQKKKKKEKSDETSTDAKESEDNGDESKELFDELEKVISEWFIEYNIQMWAYWRSYGGDRRGSGDDRSSFQYRMGLVPPTDLPISNAENPIERLAVRFWTFASKLRLSGEALYTFAKALLRTEKKIQIGGWCVDLLKVAISSTHEIKIPPYHYNWQPEFTGNAAFLLAHLMSEEVEEKEKAINQAIKAVKACILRYSNYKDLGEKTKPEQLESMPNNRGGVTYYHAQRVEIIRQLRGRIESLEELKKPGQIEKEIEIKHISEALKDTNNARIAYCLCYGLCEVMFEWYVDQPFLSLDNGSMSAKWMKHREEEAEKLGAETSAFDSKSFGGVGSAEMKTEEQMNKSEKDGTAMLARLRSETEKHVEMNSESETSAPTYKWNPTAPTKDDIRASKQSRWQIVSGWISMMWDWLNSLVTAPVVRKYGLGDKGNSSKQERSQKSSLFWDTVDRLMTEQARNQDVINGDLVSRYIEKDATKLIGIVEELGPYLRHTDLVQEDVEIRKDGKTKEKISRGKAKKQAKEEAANQVHLRKDEFPEEDMYLIGKTLEELKKMAKDQKLVGFDNKFRKLLEAISQYNEFAQDGKVDPEIARRMNEGMKKLWENTLRFAKEHGTKIQDLKTALDNYNIVKNQSKLIEKTKRVYVKAKKAVGKVVEVGKKAVSVAWKAVKWFGRQVKKVGKAALGLVKKIPVVGKWVEKVEQVVNEAFATAKKFFKSVAETLSSFVSRITKSIRIATNFIYEAVKDFLEKLGRLTLKAWDLVKNFMDAVKETWVWKGISKKLVSAFKWVAKRVIWLFVKVLKPIITFCFNVLNWVWSNIARPVLSWVSPFVLSALEIVKSVWGFATRYIRYWWQGAGEIMENYVWGTEFDIIDAVKQRVTRFRMRVRAALRRVWASSWLQWMLDKSIRIGLDVDQREHVQTQQGLAHNDFIRRNRLRRQRNSFAFSVVFVAFSLALFLATVVSLGTLLPALLTAAGIGLIFSTVSALLQYASLDLESDTSIDDETKRGIQNLISIARSVVLIIQLYFGNPGASIEIAFALFGKIVSYLRTVVDVLRIEQILKGALQQIDKVLRMFGIGGSYVVLMDLKNSISDMFKSILEHVQNFLQIGKMIKSKKKKKNSLREEEEQEEQEEEEEEEEEEDGGKKGDMTKTSQQSNKKTRTRSDGWKIEKKVITVGTSTKIVGKGENSRGRFHQGSVVTYTFTTPDGGKSIAMKIWRNKKNDKMEAKFDQSQKFREFTKEERGYFGFGDEAPSAEDVKKVFKSETEKEVEIISDNSSVTKSVSTFKNGKEVKREQIIANEDGKVKLKQENGKLVIMSQPKGQPKYEPVFIELLGRRFTSKKIWGGEFTEKHLRLLEKTLGSNKELMDKLIKNELQELEDLVIENKLEMEKNKNNKEKKDDEKNEEVKEEVSTTKKIGKGIMKSVLNWSWEKISFIVSSFLSILWNSFLNLFSGPLWILDNTIFRIIRFILNRSRIGRKLTEKVKNFVEKVKNFKNGVRDYGMSILKSFAVKIGLKQEENTKKPESEPVEENEEEISEEDKKKAELVERLFEALLPKQDKEVKDVQAEEENTEKETMETKLGKSVVETFQKLSEVQEDDFIEAVEVLMGKFEENSDRELSDEEKKKLKKESKLRGRAKSLYDWLYNIAKKNTPASSDDQENVDKSSGAVVHEQMVRSGGSYSRENMKFIKIKNEELGDVAGVVTTLSNDLKVGRKGIQRKVSAKQIQSDVEKFVRKGDQQGLCEYFEKLHSSPIPKEFSGMENEWKKARDEEFQDMKDKFNLLVEYGFGQASDKTVADITHELVNMMSNSVINLYVVEKIEEDKIVLEDGSESAYKVSYRNGKIKLDVDKHKLGELHELHVKKIIEKQGFEVLDSKLPRNRGFDILAVKKGEDGEVESIWIVECKATSQKDKKKTGRGIKKIKGDKNTGKKVKPKLGKTLHQDKQLSPTWIAYKMKEMYEQGGDLKENAIMLRKNLDKIKTVLAFQKEGLNSWAHQNKVPKYKSAQVEKLLKKICPELWKLSE